MKFSSTLAIFFICLTSILLQGCSLIIATGACVDYKINHWKGNLKGDRFRLVQPVYLYQSKTKNKILVSTQEMKGKDYDFIKMIPKDSIVMIVKTENPKFDFSKNFTHGTSRFPIDVIGLFMDENRELFEASIYSLFISKCVDGEYQFFANPEFLTEIDCFSN